MVGRANRKGNFEGVMSKTKGERGTECVSRSLGTPANY